MRAKAKAKDSSTIVVSGGSTSVQISLLLHSIRRMGETELAMVNLETYYSFAKW